MNTTVHEPINTGLHIGRLIWIAAVAIWVWASNDRLFSSEEGRAGSSDQSVKPAPPPGLYLECGKSLFRSSRIVPRIALSSDAQLFAANTGSGRHIGIFKVNSPQLAPTLLRGGVFDEETSPSLIRISPTNGRVAAVFPTPRQIAVCSLPIGRLSWSLTIDDTDTALATFSTDGSQLAYLDGKHIRLVNAENGARLTSMQVPEGESLFCLEVDSLRGNVVAIGKRGITLQWDTRARENVSKLRAAHGPFDKEPKTKADFNFSHGYAISRDGKLAGGIFMGAHHAFVHRWHVETGKEFEEPVMLPFPKNGDGIAFSPDLKQIVFGDDNIEFALQIFDLSNGKAQTELQGLGSPPSDIQWSADGKRIAAATSAGVYVWDATTAQLLPDFDGHEQVDFTMFSPNGKLIASTGHDGTRLWNSVNGQKFAVFYGRRAVSFTPDSKALIVIKAGDEVEWIDIKTQASIATHRLQTWDGKTDRKRQGLGAGGAPVVVQLSPRVHTATVDRECTTMCYLLRDYTVGFYQLAFFRMKEQRTWFLPPPPDLEDFEEPRLSRDATTVAGIVSDDDKSVSMAVLIDARSGATLHAWPLGGYHDGFIELSPAGGFAAIGLRIEEGVRYSIRLLEMDKGPPLKPIATRDKIDYWNDPAWTVPEVKVAFSADDALMAAGGSGDIVVWEIHKKHRRLNKLATYSLREGCVSALSISRDRAWLCTGRGDSTISIWKIPSTAP